MREIRKKVIVINKAILMGRKWNPADTNLLVKMYSLWTNKDLAIFFNRTISSIQRKATKLNLSKDHDFRVAIQSKNRLGDKCVSWKGGKKITNKGYVQILKRDYLGTDLNGYIFEHRYIMEQNLGRRLSKNEIVHHINGDKQDNRIENLKIMTNGEHTIKHHTGAIRSIETREKISQKARERCFL